MGNKPTPYANKGEVNAKEGFVSRIQLFPHYYGKRRTTHRSNARRDTGTS